MKAQQRLIRVFDDFLQNELLRNTWIETSVASVFVRRSTRLYDGHRTSCLDIANVQVKEKFRGQGIFTKLLEHAEQVNPYDLLLIENVIGGSRFIKFFQHRKHYILVEEELSLCPSFFYIGK
jgi:GNAT superfamily N-acetyltransferase